MRDEGHSSNYFAVDCTLPCNAMSFKACALSMAVPWLMVRLMGCGRPDLRPVTDASDMLASLPVDQYEGVSRAVTPLRLENSIRPERLQLTGPSIKRPNITFHSQCARY